jgi:hypothetical protein
MFKKISEKSVSTKLSIEDTCRQIQKIIIELGGKIKQTSLDNTEIEASFRYGVNFFGIIITVKIEKKIDDTRVFIKGAFKDAINNGAPARKVSQIINKLANTENMNERFVDYWSINTWKTLFASLNKKLITKWKKSSKFEKFQIVLSFGWIPPFCLVMLFLIVESITLRWTNPDLYNCIESAKRSHKWAQAMHTEALKVLDSNGKPDPNLDPYFVFNPSGEIKRCHEKFD